MTALNATAILSAPDHPSRDTRTTGDPLGMRDGDPSPGFRARAEAVGLPLHRTDGDG